MGLNDRAMLCHLRSVPLSVRLWLVLGALASACDADPRDEADDDPAAPSESGGEEEIRRSLVDPTAWSPVPVEDDPFASHRPAEVACNGGWILEGEGIEIETARCNYLALTQPLRDDIPAGAALLVDLWWQRLASVEPAQGHLALLVGDQTIVEEWIDIPGPADARSLEIETPMAFAAGSPITFHLHNHGYNTWKLEDVALLEFVEAK